MTRRQVWRTVLVAAIVAELFVLLVVAIDAGKGDACERWQEQYEAAARSGGSGGTLDYVNLGPLADLRRQRPEGCEVPG